MHTRATFTLPVFFFAITHQLNQIKGYDKRRIQIETNNKRIARGRLELPTSPLWEARSNQLSYRASQRKRNQKKSSVGGGFEPPVRFRGRLVSSEFRSATPAPHHKEKNLCWHRYGYLYNNVENHCKIKTSKALQKQTRYGFFIASPPKKCL